MKARTKKMNQAVRHPYKGGLTTPDVLRDGLKLPSTFFRQYALRFPKHTPSDAWDEASKLQIEAEKKAKLNPERVYPRAVYELLFNPLGFAQDRVLEGDELFGPRRRKEFYRYAVTPDISLNDYERGIGYLSWGFDPEVYASPGLLKVLREGRPAVGECMSIRGHVFSGYRRGIEPHTEEEIYELWRSANELAHERAQLIKLLKEDAKRRSEWEPGRRELVITPVSKDGPILTEKGRAHTHRSPTEAFNCARTPGSKEHPNPCSGKVTHWMVRDSTTYRSWRKVLHKKSTKPEDITKDRLFDPDGFEAEMDPAKRHEWSVGAALVEKFGLEVAEANSYYPRTFLKCSEDSLDYYEALTLIAEEAGVTRGEVAKVFYPYTRGAKTFPDFRRPKPDYAARERAVRQTITRAYRRKYYEGLAEIKLAASGESWPPEVPEVEEPKRPRTDTAIWKRPDGTPVYALPEGTVAYPKLGNIARWRNKQLGTHMAKESEQSEGLDWSEMDLTHYAFRSTHRGVILTGRTISLTDAIRSRRECTAKYLPALGYITDFAPEAEETTIEPVEGTASKLRARLDPKYIVSKTARDPAVLGLLSDMEYASMRLAYLERMTNAQIAAELKIGPESVKTYLNRARAKLTAATGVKPERRPSGISTRAA
jgi:DNA-binding CsgD family transcriptional regulator